MDGSGLADPPEDGASTGGAPADGDLFLEEGQRLLGAAEARLAAVERALARLDSGAYGRCEVCSEPIEPPLLAAEPSLTRCARHGAGDR